MKRKKLSVIVPCYNEQESIPYFYDEVIRIVDQMKSLKFEIIFVDDGSTDYTLSILKTLSKEDSRVHYLSFARNFGKEAAIFAGLEHCTGDYITLMDADLQDPPSLLPEMYHCIEQGYDVVSTRRITRKGEPLIRSFFAHCFYKLISKMSNIQMIDGARDYRLMTRQVVDSILLLQEYNRYSKGLFNFVGYKTKCLEYENIERVAGQTKWSFWDLVKYAMEGIVDFTTTPLFISSILGVIICFISFIAILVIIIKTLLFGDPVGGWPSMVCILLFVSGIQLLCLGIVGQYLAKVYLEVKKRPIYIIREKNL